MKHQTQKLTAIGVTTALLLVGGMIIYSAGYILALPQIFKILFNSLYFTVLLYLLIIRCKDMGTLTLLSIVLGVILSFISPIITLAIILTGVFTDLTSYILFRGYGQGKKLIISIAFYPVYAVIFSLLVTSALTVQFGSFKIIALIYIAAGIGSFILGLLGAYTGYYLNKKYIHIEKQFNIQQ